MAPGKTAPRLLQDLLTYDPRYEERAGRNLLTSQPPQHDQNQLPSPAVPYRNCRHAFVNKQEQSIDGVDCDDGDTSIDKVASYCTICRWHFDVIISRSKTRGKPCKIGDDEYPLHHFIFVGEIGQDVSNTLGSQLRPRFYAFRCSAPPCQAELTINIRPPRFADHDIETLTNKAVLRRRWEAAKEFAGDRADVMPARSVDGPDYLDTYLQDSMKPVKGKARIPLLNKKFLKTFGRDCDSILTRFGFVHAHELEDDGSSVEVWYLPRPEEPKGSLELTLRDVIHDARYELDSIIAKIPESERINPPPRHLPIGPTSSRDKLERVLACAGYPRRPGRIETRGTNHEEDHPHYAGLGAVGDFSDALILFAYSRQAERDVENRPYYFECLKDLANGRDSIELQTHVALLASQGETTKRDAEQAYKFFGINPAHAGVISDEHIIGSFKARLSDISPNMVEETRRQLRVLGDLRNSDRIRAEASEAIETYDQALNWFDAPPEISDDFLTTLFSMKTGEMPASLDTARKALSIIAETRQSQRLWQFLQTGTMTESEMDIGEAYALFGVNDRTQPVDLEVLRSTLELPDSSDIEKLRKAFALIEQDQAQTHGNTLQNANLGAKSKTPDYPLETWPVGLRNIGNTCYLNSVLQFLFTIKPLREMILDCDKYLQDPSPEALANKKVGRSVVTADRVETAQKFIHELRALFQRMITAPTDTVQPDIKVAALALCKADGLQPTAEPSGPAGGDSKAEPDLGSIDGLPVSGPMLPKIEAVGPEASGSTMNDTAAADRSSQAMDLDSQNSAPAPPTRKPPPIPARLEAQANISLSKVEESARQQDAAEVMGNIFDLLSCAIRGEGLMREDEQFDKIKELFFSDVTTVQKINNEEKKLEELRDHFLVAPGKGDRSLYVALDNDFGEGDIEGGGIRYDYIAKAAPIQIINLRRLQHQNKRVVYEDSQVTLENPLYLDRYLEKTKTLDETQLLKLRENQWEEQRKFREIGAKRQKLEKTDIDGMDLADTVKETGFLVKTFLSQDDQIEQEGSRPGSLPTPPPEELVENLHEKSEQLKEERQFLDKLSNELEQKISTVFKDHNEHPYRLHTVFTHRGNIRGGHYFVYIYDFQAGQWRSYNDEYVKPVEDTEVYGPLVSTGLVYVRADLAEQYTEAVCRQPEKPAEATDVEMAGIEDKPPPLEPMDTTDYHDVQIIEGIEKDAAKPKLSSSKRKTTIQWDPETTQDRTDSFQSIKLQSPQPSLSSSTHTQDSPMLAQDSPSGPTAMESGNGGDVNTEEGIFHMEL